MHPAWSICSSRKCLWVMLLIPNPGTLAGLTLLQAQSLSACPPLIFRPEQRRGHTRGSQEAKLICALLSFTSSFQDLLCTAIY